MSKPSDLIQGTLDLLILKTLALEPKHGWAIARAHPAGQQGRAAGDAGLAVSGAASAGAAGMAQGAGRASPPPAATAKFYALTAAGRKQLARELESWDRLSNAIGLVVREAD